MSFRNIWHEQNETLYHYDPQAKAKNALAMSLYYLARTASMFEYEGLPETMPRRDVEMLLQTCGALAGTRVNGELYVFFGGLGGEPDVYYKPTIFTVSNPALNYSANLRIGEDCVLLRNDSVYMGLLPLICKAAYLRVENELSLYINDINSRITSIISAQTDSEEASAKSFIEQIREGNLGVVTSSKFSDGLKTLPYSVSGHSNSVLQLIEYQQYLKASLYNELGLNANYNMKRSQLNDGEIEVNRESLLPYVDDMKRCRKEDFDAFNRKYGTNIKVDYFSSWAMAEELADSVNEGMIEDETSDNTTE